MAEGTGATPEAASDVVFVKYTGKLADGTVFDQSQDMPFPVEGMLPEGMPMQLAAWSRASAKALHQDAEGRQVRPVHPGRQGLRRDARRRARRSRPTPT